MNLNRCWFTHGDRLRDRDAQGRYVLTCQTCGDVQILLADDVVRGPLVQQAEVKGRPKLKAVKTKWFIRKTG